MAETVFGLWFWVRACLMIAMVYGGFFYYDWLGFVWN
jgi:hypothetical protein